MLGIDDILADWLYSRQLIQEEQATHETKPSTFPSYTKTYLETIEKMVRADERVSSTTALSHKLEELACNGNSLDIHPSKLLYASPWIDQVKEHAGIRLSDRALLCPTHAQAEKLDSMMCSCKFQ